MPIQPPLPWSKHPPIAVSGVTINGCYGIFARTTCQRVGRNDGDQAHTGGQMSILLDLVKVGAIGASLAFLLLSYRLLKRETELKDKDGNPAQLRPLALLEIRKFRWSALLFLVVGVLSEFFLSHGTEVVAGMHEVLFRNELVRVRFNDWEFFPAKREIAFGFEQDRFSAGRYVAPALSDRYRVYVGVRKKTGAAADQGQYDLMVGPYPISNQLAVPRTLTDDDMKALGSDCVEFTAFGIQMGADKPIEITLPFDPGKWGAKAIVFNRASACK
jgi:hypothetical protein